MAGEFKIEIPITLRGGREGKRVGKQIGEKIAAQLRKSLSLSGFGSKKGAGGISGISGMTRGLKGIATKLGVLGIAVGAVVGLLAKASPYLKGILSLFGRAFMIFFRPFGDFLATLLRPMAILMMKMAVAFMKWLRPLSKSTREAMEGAPQFEQVDGALANFAIGIANWAIQLGAAIGDLAVNIGKGAFDLGVKIGEWFYDKIIVPVSDFILEKIRLLFPGVNKQGVQQGVTLGGGGGAIGAITGRTPTAIETLTGGSTSGAVPNVIANVVGQVIKAKERIESRSLFGVLGKALGNLLGFANGGRVPGPMGSPQLAVVHGGEEVVARRNQNKSIILNPTFQFSGNISSEMDADAIARRASKTMVEELKKRGVI